MSKKQERAVLAAGCFWGVQDYFDRLDGVAETTCGYTGGHTVNPTYQEVGLHTTGHAEAVEVVFDPQTITYRQVLEHFFKMHDPTQVNRQGPDIGDSYRSAIFYIDDTQRDEAKKLIDELTASKVYRQPIATQVVKSGPFYRAEEYHQKYFQKTGVAYCRLPGM